MTKKNKRHYYIDLIRGIAFILMMIYHFIYDIAEVFYGYWAKYFSSDFYLNIIARFLRAINGTDITKYLRLILIACIFLFISGISSILSKNIFKRGIKLFAIAMALTLGTMLISIIMQIRYIVIYFGILHCLSICMILTPLFKKTNRIVLLGVAIIIISLGIYFDINPNNRIYVNTWVLTPLYITSRGFYSADYYPLIPYMGFYLLGYIFGDWYFNIKKKPKRTKKYNENILTYFGKNTLVWYFIHQIVLIVFLIIFTLINLIFV